jgi:hypothetical protein
MPGEGPVPIPFTPTLPHRPPSEALLGPDAQITTSLPKAPRLHPAFSPHPTPWYL